MSVQIEVQNGDLELVPTPGHVNLLGSDGEVETEIRLNPHELKTLRDALRDNLPVSVDNDEGLVSWEPERGLYLEVYAGESHYLILSPEDREQIAEKMATVEPLA